MMATDPIHDLDNVFDDHPSLDASLEDFEEQYAHRSPFFGLPSQHSGFRSGISEASPSEQDGNISRSSSPWSPPGLRATFTRPEYQTPKQHSALGYHPAMMAGAAWYRQQPYMRNQPDFKPEHLQPHSPGTRSREVSPQYEDAPEKPTSTTTATVTLKEETSELILPATIPLPQGTDSPIKGRSPSPVPESRTEAPKTTATSTAEAEERNKGDKHEFKAVSDCKPEKEPESITNYIRFAVRAEVQHREPFVAFFNYMGAKFDSMTQTRSSTLLSVAVALISLTFMRALFLPPPLPPVPDIVKLSSFTRSFEPLIYYSENGVQQIGTLQETGVAVWDLAESVRGTNMTSAPIIVRELDELSQSLNSLSLELTRFFANVDADIDSILIVMEWARRELEALSSQPPNTLSSIFFDNFHNMLSRLGVLETLPTSLSANASNGLSNETMADMPVAPIPTRLGSLITALFGRTRSQRTQLTLTHAFTELLSVLEESINNELTHSTSLFTLFESIDRQFLNLQRTVVRESNAQERAEGELLSSLWTRVLGSNAMALRKYEKNRRLLSSVRQRTVANKHLLMDHRGRLLALKANLEALRRKLVSPLLRGGNSSMGMTLGPLVGISTTSAHGGGVGGSGEDAVGGENAMEMIIHGQIKGLDGAHDYLKEVRDKQKAKLMEMVYGAGRRVGGNALVDGDVDGEGEGEKADIEEMEEK
ncbi:hypothetical protein H109_07466 [Trichophyton interdigitale MR816]|uniref:Uncharacterized protein n=1 Tax=Trichophyton interdigitale (strain MR816) TaxID=1215338 RepID=A0A059IY60_TRIIM|nr:hypothetical protein H101_03595 [Trichophyton interdigitale H6]KDB20561.1 hypothetical protein H109_07466 [Trichophyton interdigitale MR816]